MTDNEKSERKNEKRNKLSSLRVEIQIRKKRNLEDLLPLFSSQIGLQVSQVNL